LAREKGGIDASRIASDPAFQRTHENGVEFGRAGKAGKVLRTAMRTLLINSADGRIVSRLSSSMIKVVQTDMVSERGLRNLIAGEAELLCGFEFNIRGKLGTSLFAPFVVTIDRALGGIMVDLVPFVTANTIAAASGTTHFKIIFAGAEIDFEGETLVVATSETDILARDSNQTVDINHIHSVTPGSTKLLFLALGIEFYQEVNERMYPLKKEHTIHWHCCS
jgi:hypothetical protein